MQRGHIHRSIRSLLVRRHSIFRRGFSALRHFNIREMMNWRPNLSLLYMKASRIAFSESIGLDARRHLGATRFPENQVTPSYPPHTRKKGHYEKEPPPYLHGFISLLDWPEILVRASGCLRLVADGHGRFFPRRGNLQTQHSRYLRR